MPPETESRCPHKDLGGVEVIDEEGAQAAGQGGGEHRQVVAAIPGGHGHIEQGHGDGHAGGQAVDAVGEVHGVHRAHHDKGGKDHIQPPGHGELHVEEGDIQGVGQIAAVAQQHREHDGRRQLEQELLGAVRPSLAWWRSF